jgi:hypothetical protein
MQYDIPLSIGTPWGTRAWRYRRDQGYSIERAIDQSLLDYLSGGEIRALLDLLKHGKQPGKVVIKYLAAMIVPDCRVGSLSNIRYAFKLEPNRKVGGQKRDEQGTRLAEIIECILARGADAMAKGRVPDESFWSCFECALEPQNWRCALSEAKPWGIVLIPGPPRAGRGF